MSIVRSLSSNLVNFVGMIGPIIVLAGGAYLVAGGGMKLGALMAFFFLLSYLYSPIQGLASINVEVQGAMASVNRIFEYLDVAPEVSEDLGAISPKGIKGDIAFENLTFSYGPEAFKLTNFSLKIPACQKLALVGPSGSGKTTIVSLLMRFYDPEKGCVTLDGMDLKNISINSLRKGIALVDQEPMLFNMTIHENIAYSNPKMSRAEVISAAKTANIHELIVGLKEGYETMVGERGVTLSGGEKQRLCLARAIASKPSILILDEATSALDSISERLIQEALDKILSEMTAIIIAHRLSTVQKADRIIALSNGVIVGEGTHGELLENSALYRELAQKQFQT
jgi:ABC-type multidrug transport system fused ATPase/permease subunit